MSPYLIAVVSFSAVVAVFSRSAHISKRELPDTQFTFDCSDKPIGYYADVDFDCQVFHMCDAFGRAVPYICPNETKFHQHFRVCDWSYNVDCEDSPNWYYLNDLTYQKEVEDYNEISKEEEEDYNSINIQ